MSMSFYPERHELIIHGDFATVEDKVKALKAARFLTMESDFVEIDPQRKQDVVYTVTNDVMPPAVEMICRAIGTELELG